MNQIWVKKLVSKSEFDHWYSKQNTYCQLKVDSYGVWIGFVIADPDPNYLPEGCYKMTPFELIQVDDYRRPRNIRPFPLEEIIDKPKKEVSSKTITALNEVRDKLVKKVSVPKIEPDEKQTIRVEDIPF